MRISILIILISFALLGCRDRGTDFEIGKCFNPVDGSQVWKIEKVEGDKAFGKQWAQGGFSDQVEELEDRIYSQVPCPTK